VNLSVQWPCFKSACGCSRISCFIYACGSVNEELIGDSYIHQNNTSINLQLFFPFFWVIKNYMRKYRECHQLWSVIETFCSKFSPLKQIHANKYKSITMKFHLILSALCAVSRSGSLGMVIRSLFCEIMPSTAPSWNAIQTTRT